MSAGGTLDVSGGESVRVVSDVVRVESSRSLDVSSSSASLVVSDVSGRVQWWLGVCDLAVLLG